MVLLTVLVGMLETLEWQMEKKIRALEELRLDALTHRGDEAERPSTAKSFLSGFVKPNSRAEIPPEYRDRMRILTEAISECVIFVHSDAHQEAATFDLAAVTAALAMDSNWDVTPSIDLILERLKQFQNEFKKKSRERDVTPEDLVDTVWIFETPSPKRTLHKIDLRSDESSSKLATETVKSEAELETKKDEPYGIVGRYCSLVSLVETELPKLSKAAQEEVLEHVSFARELGSSKKAITATQYTLREFVDTDRAIKLTSSKAVRCLKKLREKLTIGTLTHPEFRGELQGLLNYSHETIKDFGSVEKNQQFASELSKLLQESSVHVRCIGPDCRTALSNIVRVRDKGTGIWLTEHQEAGKRRLHGGPSVIPLFTVVPS